MSNPGRIDYESSEENIKLDVKDKKILQLLSENARTPLTQVAKEVALSRDAIDYRIKRLERLGILQKCFAEIDVEKLGFYVFHVFLSIDENYPEKVKELIAFLVKHPQVYSVIEYSDRWDLEIALLAKNLLEFDRIIMEISEKFSMIILEKDALEVIKKYNERYTPLLLKKKQEVHLSLPERGQKVELDATDRKLLHLLSEDCRASTYDLGKSLGVNADTVSYRIKHLVKEGVIKRFTTQVNFSLMKYWWYTFSVELRMFDVKSEQKFLAFLEDNQHIMRSVKTLGGWDLILYIVVENPREFHRIVKEIKNTFAQNIQEYQTWVAYKEYVFKTAPDVING